MEDEVKCVCLPYGEPADLCMCRPRAGSQIVMAEQNVQFAKEDAEDALRRLASRGMASVLEGQPSGTVTRSVSADGCTVEAQP